MNLLIIDLNKTALYQVLLLAFAVRERDDLTERPGDNSFRAFILVRPHHCMCFPASRLAIGEYGSIIALNHTVYERKSSFFVDKALQGI